MDQVSAMRIFAKVAELGSFTAAAEHLGMLKATASLAVRELEERLGTRLLHRTTRKVQLTQDGQLFLERSHDLLADMDELTALFSQRDPANLTGKLRVDMPQALARDLVIPHLPAFLARHPALELELSSTDRRVDVVREGFDCVIRVGSVGEQGLVAIPLGQLEQINCASADYLTRHGIPHQVSELERHHLIHYAQTLGQRAEGFCWLDAEGTLQRQRMKGALTVNNSEAYQRACLAGLGIIQAPKRGVAHHLASGTLVELLPQYSPPPLPVTLLYAHRRHQPLRVRVMMEWLKTLLIGTEQLVSP